MASSPTFDVVFLPGEFVIIQRADDNLCLGRETEQFHATDTQIIPASAIPCEAVSTQCLPDKLAYYVYIIRTNEHLIVPYLHICHLTSSLLSQISHNPANSQLMKDIITYIFDIVFIGSSYPPVTAVALGMPHVLHPSGVREFGVAAFLVNSMPPPIQREHMESLIANLGDDERLAIIGTTNVSKDRAVPMIASLESLQFQLMLAAQSQEFPLFPPTIKGYERAIMAMSTEYAPEGASSDMSRDCTLAGTRRVASPVDVPLQQMLGDNPYLPAKMVTEKLFHHMESFCAMNYLKYDYFSVGDAILYHFASNEQGRENTIGCVLLLVRRIWMIDGVVLPNVFVDSEILVHSDQPTESLRVFLSNTIVTLPVSDPTICKGIRRIPLTLVMGASLQDNKHVSFHVPLQGGPDNLLYPEACCAETYIRTCHVIGTVRLSEITQCANLFQEALECSVQLNKCITLSKHSVEMHKIQIYDLEEEDQEELIDEANLGSGASSSKAHTESASTNSSYTLIDSTQEPSLKQNMFSGAKGLYLQPLISPVDDTSQEKPRYQVQFLRFEDVQPIACTICKAQLNPADLFIGDLSSIYGLDVQRLLSSEVNGNNDVTYPTIETALMLNSQSNVYQCPHCFNTYCRMCKAEMLNSSSDAFLYQINSMIASAHKRFNGFKNLNTPCWKCNISDYTSAGICADSSNPLVALYLHTFLGFTDGLGSKALLDPQKLSTDFAGYFSRCVAGYAANLDPTIAIQLAANQFLHELDALRSSWHFASNLVEWKYAPTCAQKVADDQESEERLQNRTRSLTSLLDLISTIRYSYPSTSEYDAPEENRVLVSMDLRHSIPSLIQSSLYSSPLPMAGLYENSNLFMLSIFPHLWKYCNSGANLFFYGAPFYSRLYLDLYQGRDLAQLKQIPLDTPQDPVVRKRTRGKTANSNNTTDAIAGSTGRRRASSGATVTHNIGSKVNGPDSTVKAEDKPATQSDDSIKKPSARRSKATLRSSKQMNNSNTLFQSDVNGIPLVAQTNGLIQQPSSLSLNSSISPAGTGPGGLQITPGGGLSHFGSGLMCKTGSHVQFSDTTSVIFPTSYIENYLMPNLTQEALSSWIGQSIRPFIVPTQAKVMHSSGVPASEIDNAGAILLDASSINPSTTPETTAQAKQVLHDSAVHSESSIVKRQQKSPFTLPSSVHIARLKAEISENCLFYTGFDKTLRYLLEEYSECDSNAWMDDELKAILKDADSSETPISKSLPILQKLKSMLSSHTDEPPDAATILKHITKDILPEFLETRFQLETHYDYGHTSENVRTLQTINSLVNVSAFSGICECEDEKLLDEIKRERAEILCDEEEEAKEIISLTDKDLAKKLTGQQALLAVDELTANPPQYNLKPPLEANQLPPKPEYHMIDDEQTAASGKSVAKKITQKAELVESLTRKIACINFLLTSIQRRDNTPSESTNGRSYGSTSIISTDENVNQTFPKSATMRHLILEKREAELRSYLEMLSTVEARTRRSMEELLTSIDAVRRGMIELRRKQAGLVDELVDFVKEKYRLDHTITDVASVIGDIAVALSAIRIPATDRQLPSDIQCLKRLKKTLSEKLMALL